MSKAEFDQDRDKTMKIPHIQWVSGIFAAALACVHGVGVELESRRILQNGVRHNVLYAPHEINVDAKNTYDSKFMALMKSPCRPELDGYFGSTSGVPVGIQFGFKIETTPLAQITNVMEAVEDQVVDAILSSEFPKMCGFRRQRRLSRATGFRFLKFKELPGACHSNIDPVNFCGVFTGGTYIFGIDQSESALEVLSIVNAVLNTNDAKGIHQDLLGISTVDELESVNENPEGSTITQGESNLLFGLPRIGLAGVGLAILIVGSGLVWLAIDRRKRHNLMMSEGRLSYSHDSKSLRGEGLFGSLLRSNRQSKRQSLGEYDPEAKSIRPSPQAEAVDFGAGNMLLLTDGRPVEIEFDRTYSSNMAQASIDPRAVGII